MSLRVRIRVDVVPVAQWQSASLWMRRLRVRNPSGTPLEKRPTGRFSFILDVLIEVPQSADLRLYQ
jgi:hypothetical protein